MSSFTRLRNKFWMKKSSVLQKHLFFWPPMLFKLSMVTITLTYTSLDFYLKMSCCLNEFCSNIR
ncbi:hypothetical protein AB205_0044580 [Aquarana catesbeiana]|uniref:Uncharacterized protein n=1 Tax=Aquarana catesbeiana TaxID=8400 RepID=A0A2G9RW09_AQUCT|nr:hypothetical protein AB205_0044580 [Aquarana catesbeiana]